MLYINGKSEEYYDLSHLNQFRCNELTVDVYGNIYLFCAENTFDNIKKINLEFAASIILIKTEKIEIIPEGLIFPNSMIISEDNKTLLIGETFALRITAFDIEKNRKLINKKIFAECQSDMKPCGLMLDFAGVVWLTLANSFCIRIEKGGEIAHLVNTEGENCLRCMMNTEKNFTYVYKRKYKT